MQNLLNRHGGGNEMYEFVQGLFISLIVGTILLVLQVSLDYRKKLFGIIAYCMNIGPAVLSNKRILKKQKEIYEEYYGRDEKNNFIQVKNIDYSKIKEYIELNHHPFHLIPEISSDVIRKRFLAYYYKMDDLNIAIKQFDEYMELLENEGTQLTNYENLNQIVFGMYNSLCECFNNANYRFYFLEKAFDKYTSNEILINENSSKKVNKILREIFINYSYMEKNLERLDNLFNYELKTAYEKLRLIEYILNIFRVIIFVLVIIMGVILIA